MGEQQEFTDPEDAKLATLARAARARLGGQAAAAVRDDMGRTYVGATVELPSLQLSALQAAVAQAVSSGAQALEAAVVVSAGDAVDEQVVRDLSADAVVHVVGP